MNQFSIVPASRNAVPEKPYHGRHFINGQWQDSADGKTFDRVSPSHGVVVSTSALAGEPETLAAISAARMAFDDGRWSRLSGKARASFLLKIADLIGQNVERMAVL